MIAETYKTLLKDLQRLEKRIAEAHIAAVRASPALQAVMAKRHAAAEVGGRTDDYTVMAARKSAVQFLLRTVYVRVLEDLGALEPVRIRGTWGEEAFRLVAPGLGKRAYFAFVFRDLAADFPSLFAASDEELGLPGEDLCREAWTVWQKPDGKGGLLYDWRSAENGGSNGGFDSRFLGDLYQDLDAEVRKRFALLQTPHFVESYILDKTLTPALVEFDPGTLVEQGETFRVLDPTCGSGHFLIGAWKRLAGWWDAKGKSPWEAAQLALDSVWGADINAHAVDIARFRLLLEVMARTGERELGRLKTLKFNLAVMDSLIPWERGAHAATQGALFAGNDLLSSYATAEERARNASFLNRAFHVVVGNPPYITPKDVKKRDDYRVFWPNSAAGKYALSAPFVERLFVLAKGGGFMGQITANSFMKREFGRKLIEVVFPGWDLTGVIDTSGAYIPGHGTPTAILLGRGQVPVLDTVWAVLGKRGEPSRPEVAARGLVWMAIVSRPRVADDTNPFVTSSLVRRAIYEVHPWSLGGGEAGGVKAEVEEAGTLRMGEIREISIGNLTKMIQDDVYIAPDRALASDPACGTIELLEGTFVRDYDLGSPSRALYPYRVATRESHDLPRSSVVFAHFWRHRPLLNERQGVGFKTVLERGIRFYEYPFYAPYTVVGYGIPFGFVATHNHFVLDRGGKVFNRSAPVIKLPAAASQADHLDLLGLLNSSALGFWMKQVFHCKGYGAGADNARTTADDWENFYEYDSTKLQQAPLTDRDREPRISLASALDSTASERAACLPAAVLAASDWTPATLSERLSAARNQYRALTEKMVALQEELDWLTYGSYQLIEPLPTVSPSDAQPLAPGHRPFEIVAARADDEADDDEKSKWWSRHGHDRVTEVPARYSPAHSARIEARMAAIEADARLQLLESFAYKRRWQTPDLAKETTLAAERWLLDRLEDLFAVPSPPTPLPQAGEGSIGAKPPSPLPAGVSAGPAGDASSAAATPHTASGSLKAPKPYRLEAVVSAWQRDPRVLAVASVYSGEGAHTDLSTVAEKLLRGAALPDNPRRVYTAEGLRKLDEWKRVWTLQDQEDAAATQLTDPRTNEPLRDESGEVTNKIPLPPKFDKGDFQSNYFGTRGKLNVPRERFIVFDQLSPARYGWNGWRDRDRALAQVEAFSLAENHPDSPLPTPTSDDPRRCGATYGLWESLPDVKRWAGADEHAELHALAQEVCRQPRCPCPVVEKWAAWKKGDLVIGAEQDRMAASPSVSERGAAMALFDKVQTSLLAAPEQYDELPMEWLTTRWKGAPDRLDRVLDDLVATGDLVSLGRGNKRRFSRKAGKA